MSQLFMHINATIVSTETKTSQKGNEYLKVVIRDEFRNTMSLCDMNIANEDKYAFNVSGDMLVKFSQSRSQSGTYTNLSIEDFVPVS